MSKKDRRNESTVVENQKQQPAATEERDYKGVVQFYKKGKGFGFIRENAGKDRKDDVFVHFTDVEKAGLKSLVPDQKVAYDVGEYDRKYKVKDENGGETEKVEKAMKAINLIILE